VPRVVLDTNVLISGLVYPSGTPGKIISMWFDGKLDVVLSAYILGETARVIPTLKPFELDAVQALIDSISTKASVVVPTQVHEPELRDADDLEVLGTLLASGAAYLVTGDKDLLALAGRYPVVTPAEFWARHG
jgi:putative PIN family toxin of toxin-antitoxin system